MYSRDTSCDYQEVMSRAKALPLVLVIALSHCAGCGSSPGVTAQANGGQVTGAEANGAPPSQSAAGRSTSNALKDATFDDLKFEIEIDGDFEPSMLTPKVKDLFERRIRIRGYIFPTLKKRGIKQFVLVRDNLECCFGPGAALFDCILVHMQEGKTAEFSIRPVAVEGKFSFEEFRDYDGTVRAIFRLDGESVE